MQKIFKNKKLLLIPIIIFCLAFFLRIHNLPNIYVFNLDEEYQATYAWTEVLKPHPIWIGVVAAAIEFYLGPYFTYFTSILLKISNGNPLITAYFAALVGASVSTVIFFTGRYFFNITTGIISSLLYATLPIFVFFDQKYWNPMFNLLIVLLLLISINLVRKSKWWWILFSLLLGAIFELHLAPIPIALIGFWYFIKGKYWKDLKLIAICILVFLILYWPLIVFDFNHNFSNLTFFMKFRNKTSQLNLSFNPISKMYSFFDSIGRFWYLKPGAPNADEINFGCTSLSGANGHEIIDKYTERTYAPIWISSISVGILFFFLWKNFKNQKYIVKLLMLFLIVSSLLYLFYPGGSFEYYNLEFLMLFTFIPGLLISSLSYRYKIASLFAIALVLILAVNTVIRTSDEFSLGPKRILISKIMKIVDDKPFAIEGRGICHNYEGWRYLFKIYGKVPVQSYTDKILGWLYPKELSTIKPAYTIILSEDRIPLTEDLSGLQSIKEGGYRAYIRKNQ